MMKYFVILSILSIVVLSAWGTQDKKAIELTDEMTVSELLEILGKDFSSKKPDMSLKGVSVASGKSLFHDGFSKKINGKKSRKQSKHFVCTSCHNVQKEDPNLAISDPQARLDYTAKKGLPFLQGTTMYGAVSRSTYYNGDYDKKYGDLVQPARHDIRGAIQLCAVECAQGRSLKDWELESLLAYLWTIDLNINDLALSDVERDSLRNIEVSDEEKIALIESKYLSGSPTHFSVPPADRKQGTGLKGNPENGKLVYENSCLHCHYQGKYSYLHLDNSKLTFKYLAKTTPSYHSHSIYQVTRWGVPSKQGKESYMPQYPLEKMSDQQLTDLVTYIQNEAK